MKIKKTITEKHEEYCKKRTKDVSRIHMANILYNNWSDERDKAEIVRKEKLEKNDD